MLKGHLQAQSGENLSYSKSINLNNLVSTDQLNVPFVEDRPVTMLNDFDGLREVNEL